ncbi:hypothetical protein B0J17DRAFT_719992 [Rhizoctonia solani]|nr:hypothetical protein B0J17DRAFT_719992 [Rhizoctonia solani]
MAPTSGELPGPAHPLEDEYSDQTSPEGQSSSQHRPHDREYSDAYQTSNNPSPPQYHPHESEYSGTYQPPPINTSSSRPQVPQLTYPPQPSYYAPYSQPTTQRNMAQVPFSYQSYSPITGPSTVQSTEGSYLTSPYSGSYGAQSQPTLGSHRGDPFYYTQPTPSPTTPTTTEGSYGHQYMPFRQTHIGLSYAGSSQPSSSQLPIVLDTSHRLVSPDQTVGEHRARGDEFNYGSLASSYRHIMSTVTQASPSPTTDSSGQSFEPPIVEDMLHRAVEGLRYLDPTRAEQFAYPGEPGAQPIASGAVASEGSPETVFVRYYEDGRSESNPTKKKKRERKGATQCASCHATSTPEWRRGPLGPRTLCNACGLVYAKLMKKRAKEEEKLSPGGSPRRARSKGKSRELTEESEEDREHGSDDTLPPIAGPSGMSGGGYPP